MLSGRASSCIKKLAKTFYEMAKANFESMQTAIKIIDTGLLPGFGLLFIVFMVILLSEYISHEGMQLIFLLECNI